MNNRLTVLNAIQKNNDKVLLEIENNQSLNDYRASGQMLVDSDNLSFIYLLEKDDRYTYIALPDTVWNDIKFLTTEPLPVVLTNGSEQILLTQFREELTYLIENIKGNSNYGETMVNKVEVVFE
jgi:hypothetical protein